MLKRKLNSLTTRETFKINNRYAQPPTKLFTWLMIIIAIILTIFGFMFLKNSWEEFFSSFSQLGDTIKEMLKWDFKKFSTPNSFGDTFLGKAFTSLGSTLIMSFSGTIIGVAIAIPVAMCSSFNIIHNKFINNLCKTIMALLRTIPAFTFALILIGYFGQTTLSVTIAIAIFTFSITGKLFLERIEHVNFKIYSAMQATGASKMRSFRSAIVPQISHNILSITFYSLETNIRYIAIIGGMSSVGIGELIQNNIDFQQWDRAGFLLFLLIMVVLILEIIIYFVKNFILKDKDFILDFKERESMLSKTKKRLKKTNLKFYISEVIIQKYKKIKETTHLSKAEKKNLNNKQKEEVKYFKFQHKNNIKKDVLHFETVKQTEVNSKKWFVYNDILKQNVRLDKTYLTKFNIEVESMKSKLYQEFKLEIAKKHEEYLKELTNEKALKSAPKKWIKRAILYTVLIALFIYSFSKINFHLESEATIKQTNSNIKSILNISWNSLFSKTDVAPYSVIYLLFETLSIAIVGTVLGVIMAYILGLLSAETIVNIYVAKVFVIITSIIRAVPTYIYAIIFISLVGLGPFNGAIALAMGTTGMLTKYNREIFEDVNLKISSQLQATGLNSLQRFRYGIIPQTTSSIISYIIYRFDINFKEVSSLGIVGAGNLGYLLSTYFNDQLFNEFGALLFGIALFTLLIEYIATILRTKLNQGVNPKFIDYLIIEIKNKMYIKYKANEYLINKKAIYSYDESRAFYSYINKKLFELEKIIRKENGISHKDAYLKAFSRLANTTFESYEELSSRYRLITYKLTKDRIDYLNSIKSDYKENIKQYKTTLKENIDKKIDTNTKYFKIEYKKSKKNAKDILKYKRSSLA